MKNPEFSERTARRLGVEAGEVLNLETIQRALMGKHLTFRVHAPFAIEDQRSPSRNADDERRWCVGVWNYHRADRNTPAVYVYKDTLMEALHVAIEGYFVALERNAAVERLGNDGVHVN